ncbi:Acyltransferase, partial [Opisthorchis viverrini]
MSLPLTGIIGLKDMQNFNDATDLTAGDVTVELSVRKGILETEVPCEPLPVSPNIPFSTSRGLRFGVITFLLLLSAYFGSIFFQGPLLPLAFLAPKLFRWCIDWTMASWLLFSEFLIVKVAGVRVRHFGDDFLPHSPDGASLLLLNHRTQLDWLFAWGLGAPVQRMKIILKESLAKFPGVGWAMQCASFIFIRRQIATDQSRIDTLISYLLNSGAGCEAANKPGFGTIMSAALQFMVAAVEIEILKFDDFTALDFPNEYSLHFAPASLLIFPEGTNLCSTSLARSNQFARKANLPYVAYTLHPRCTGFVYLVTLLGRHRLSAIYDVTVAYPDHIPFPEIDVFAGKVPQEVHYHVRRISASELPWDCPDGASGDLDERLAGWLRAQWMAKEAFLKEYYARPVEERRFKHEVQGQSQAFQRDTITDQLHPTLLGLANAIFWFISLIVFTYYLYISWIVFSFAVLVQITFVYLSIFSGGINFWASKQLGGPLLTGPVRSLSERS